MAQPGEEAKLRGGVQPHDVNMVNADQQVVPPAPAPAPPAPAPAPAPQRAARTMITLEERKAIGDAITARQRAKEAREAARNRYAAQTYNDNEADAIAAYNALQPQLSGLSFYSVRKTSQTVKSVYYFKWGKNSWGVIVGDGN